MNNLLTKTAVVLIFSENHFLPQLGYIFRIARY